MLPSTRAGETLRVNAKQLQVNRWGILVWVLRQLLRVRWQDKTYSSSSYADWISNSKPASSPLEHRAASCLGCKFSWSLSSFVCLTVSFKHNPVIIFGLNIHLSLYFSTLIVNNHIASKNVTRVGDTRLLLVCRMTHLSLKKQKHTRRLLNMRPLPISSYYLNFDNQATMFLTQCWVCSHPGLSK